MWRSSRRIWWAAFAIGAVVRVATILLLWSRGATYPDEASYWLLGRRLRDGHGLSFPEPAFDGLIGADEPTAYFGLFPVITALLGAITGDSLLASRLILGVAAWVALAFGVRRVCEGEQMPRLGLCAVAALAIYPPLHFISSFLMTETLLAPLTVWLVVLGQILARSPNLPWGAAFGLIYGLTHLIKVNLVPFQFVHLAVVLWRAPRGTAIRSGLSCVAVTVLVLSPWVIRNYDCYGTPCLETKSGFNLWLMNNPRQQEPFWREEFRGGVDLPDFTGLNEYQRSAACRGRFVEYARGHPGRIAELCAARFLNTWPTLPVYLALPAAVRIPLRIGMAFLYAALVWGIVLALKRRELLVPALLVLYAAMACALTNGAIRHRAYAEPFVVVLAVFPLVERFARTANRPDESTKSTAHS